MAAIRQQWNLINMSVRNQIFTNTFQLLGLEEFKVVSPICLACLCVMESQNDTWKHLVAQLQENVRSPNTSMWLKKASLTTLGYISQEMSEQFTNDISTEILNAVAIGVANNDLKKPAASALHNVLDSVYDFVENKVFRDQILKLIIQLTCQEEQDDAVRIKGFACLVKIADIYFDYLSEYINGLFNVIFVMDNLIYLAKYIRFQSILSRKMFLEISYKSLLAYFKNCLVYLT